MALTRIYLPLDGAGVRTLRDSRRIGSGPVRAYAVTAALERANPADRLEEELEFVALVEAADVAREVAGAGKRVVAAADVDSTLVGAPAGGAVDRPSAVDVVGPLELGRFVSLHVDEEAGGADEDLLWYDVTEIDEVVRLTT